MDSSLDGGDTAKKGITLLVITTLLSGLIMGIFITPVLTWSVQPAQVVSGLVSYPASAIMGHYYSAAYSLTIQLSSLLLYMGVSQWALSTIISGLQGALTFTTVALVAFAFSGNRLLALATPLLLLMFPYASSDAHKYLHDFPLHFNDSGLVGIYMTLLTFTLLALGRVRPALLLLGIIPGVHASLAIVCWIGALIGIVYDRQRLGAQLRGGAKYFFIGFSIFVLSFIVQWLFIRTAFVSEYNAAPLARRLVETFLSFWDFHRTTFGAGLNHDTIRILGVFEVDFLMLVLGFYFLFFFKEYLSSSARFILIVLCVLTLISLSIVAFGEFFAQSVPDVIKMLMINRWLNLNTMVFPIAVLSLLSFAAIEKKNLPALIVFTALLALITLHKLPGDLVFTYLSRATHFSYSFKGRGWFVFVFPMIALLFPLIIYIHKIPWWVGRANRAFPANLFATLLLLLIMGTLIYKLFFYNSIKPFAYPGLRGEPSDVVLLNKASARDGFLILWHPDGWPSLMQLKTGRPILIDTTELNMLPYVVEVAVDMERILNDIYGVSLLDHSAYSGFASLKGRWRRRKGREWIRLGRLYNATNVITAQDWALDLPLVYRSKNYALYSIPK